MNANQGHHDGTEHPYRVLLLDDVENIRRLMRIFLEKAGFVVDTASNGREGLQYLLRDYYDVVVTDYRMAEMDGLTFAEEATAIWPRLGMVMMSCYVDEKMEEQARKLGVSQVLPKPVRREDFVQIIRSEAAASRHRNSTQNGDSQIEIQQQLQILRQITDSALSSQNLFDAMTELATGLQEILQCEIVGVLGLEEEGGRLLIRTSAPQRAASVKQVQQEIIRRCQTLGGQSVSREELHIQFEGPVQEEAGDSELIHVRSVPVIANNAVVGMISLAYTREVAISSKAISFLYHAANHFSTVLQAVGKIRRLSIYDPLTGAYNRLYLEQELERTWLMATRYDHVMAVMVLDVDYFKNINDEMGHAAGDEVLAEFARELRTMTRASDLLVRMGGDEFLLVLPKTQFLEAEELARRIVLHMRHHVFLVDSRKVRITTTIGLALCQAGDKVFSHHQLLEKADQALYWAKRRGRDQMAVWSEEQEQPEEIPRAGAAPYTVRHAGNMPKEEIPALLVGPENLANTDFSRVLSDTGLAVQQVATLQEGRNLLQQNTGKFYLLLSALPEKEDEESILVFAANLDPRLVRIVVSPDLTAERTLTALRQGAYDCLDVKSPKTEIYSSIQRALEYRRLLKENYDYRHYLESMIRLKTKEATQSLEEVRAAYEFTLETMVNMLDAREYETSLHSKRVTVLTRMLADHMGIQEPLLTEIARGAMLHDIGKIAIPDSILRKPEALTPDEREVMRKHPEVGFNFVKSSPFLKTAAEIVCHHHEAYDGSGYPQGLKGDQIPIGARIFSLVDSYDAMRSPRVYKHSISKNLALAEIKNQSGRQFDPSVVSRFLTFVDRLEEEAQWPNPPEDAGTPDQEITVKITGNEVAV